MYYTINEYGKINVSDTPSENDLALTDEEYNTLMQTHIDYKFTVKNGKPIPSELDTKYLNQVEMEECLQYLKDTDYIANKLAEAESEFIETGDNTEVLALRQHYSDELANRKIKRERIRELENLLKVE